MPIDQVVKLVDGLQLDSETINNWTSGVEKALKRYIPDGTQIKGQKCPECGEESIVIQDGCFICQNCGFSKCGG
mgnify:FL=1